MVRIDWYTENVHCDESCLSQTIIASSLATYLERFHKNTLLSRTEPVVTLYSHGMISVIVEVCSQLGSIMKFTMMFPYIYSVRQVAIPMLEKALSSLTIPDISGSAGTPVGSVDYSLSKYVLAWANFSLYVTHIWGSLLVTVHHGCTWYSNII